MKTATATCHQIYTALDEVLLNFSLCHSVANSASTLATCSIINVGTLQCHSKVITRPGNNIHSYRYNTIIRTTIIGYHILSHLSGIFEQG